MKKNKQRHSGCRGGLWALLAAVLIWGAASPDAQARPRKDLDGQRTGAHAIKLDKADKDKLSPPHDEVDWSYLKLQRGGTLVVRVEADGPVKIQITDASGKDLKSEEGAAGATASLKAEAGIYYIAVSSTTKVRYSLEASLK
jgi:hypothetical protein